MTNHRYLTGLAVPFGQAAPVSDPDVGAMQELFQPGALIVGDLIERMVPLLAHHDTTRPIGRVCRAWESEHGLQVEARLVAGDDDLAALERQVDAGITSGLSVGFLPNRAADEWTRHRTTGLPMVLRRQALLVEVSVVVWPAYRAARVGGISDTSTLHTETVATRAWLLSEQLAAQRPRHLHAVA